MCGIPLLGSAFPILERQATSHCLVSHQASNRSSSIGNIIDLGIGTNIKSGQMALAGLRNAVLSHIRLGVSSHAQQTLGGVYSLTSLRGFAEGTYLNKSDVTERVLHVVKNFDKVGEHKVRSLYLHPRW